MRFLVVRPKAAAIWETVPGQAASPAEFPETLLGRPVCIRDPLLDEIELRIQRIAGFGSRGQKLVLRVGSKLVEWRVKMRLSCAIEGCKTIEKIFAILLGFDGHYQVDEPIALRL